MADIPIEIVRTVGVGRTAALYGWECMEDNCYPGTGAYVDTMDGLIEAVEHERETGHRFRLIVGPDIGQV